MSLEQVNIIGELKRKIKLLGNVLHEKDEKIQMLTNEKTKLENSLRIQENELSELKQKNNTLKLSKAFINDNNGSGEAKVQINKIVREIDRCIALLNR